MKEATGQQKLLTELGHKIKISEKQSIRKDQGKKKTFTTGAEGYGSKGIWKLLSGNQETFVSTLHLDAII